MAEFPGLGFHVTLNPILLRITDSFAINWYGLIITIGLFAAVAYCLRKSGRFGIRQDDIIDMLFIVVPAAIVCGRLLYVLTNWENYEDAPLDILKTWMGGMSIYGALMGATLSCALFCWLRHIHVGAMLDLGAFGLLLGQAIGRWGNFVNGEVYGKATTLPWRMSVYGQNGYLRAAEVHPLFLYESLWNILGFILLDRLAKKRRFNGQIFGLYVVWYGAGRAVLEGLRDPAYNLLVGDILISQMIAAVSCVLAAALLFYHLVMKRHDPELLLAWQEDYERHMEFKAELKAAKARNKGSKEEEEDAAEETEEESASAAVSLSELFEDGGEQEKDKPQAVPETVDAFTDDSTGDSKDDSKDDSNNPK